MPRCIMVIDDTPAILELYRDLLTDEGYAVASYARPLRDLAEVERIEPDLIIIDYLMGGEKVGWHLLQLLQSLLLIVGSVVFLAIISWKLLLICLIPVPFVVLASIKFQRDSNVEYLTVRDRIGLTLSALQEGISGVRVIQAYGREDVEINRFAHRNDSLYRAHMRSVFVQAWYLPVIEGAALGTTALVVGIGGKMVIDGSLPIGTVAFFFSAAWLVWASAVLLIVGLILGWVLARAGYGVGGAKYQPKDH